MTPAVAAALRTEAGVTRLAELTRLDFFDVPVWQAVRPASRALSVHQGKGSTVAAARRGALMEAVESHHAENWIVPTVRRAAWSALPVSLRPRESDDFDHVRANAVSDRVRGWVEVEPLHGSAFVVPERAVGLDCTRAVPADTSVTSNGQAAHFDRDAATYAALIELIERDSVAEWLAATDFVRAVDEVDAATIADAAVLATAAARGVQLRLFRIDAVVALPVFVATLAEREPVAHAAVWGSAADADPAAAAASALLEALQTRCSQIAGSRDTIPAVHARCRPRSPAPLALPVWPGRRLPTAAAAALSLLKDTPSVVAALVAAGYPQVGHLVVSPPTSLATTVKAFVPGLGFERRRRRC